MPSIHIKAVPERQLYLVIVPAVLTRKGYNVCLLDLDVYAPALQSYFGKESRKGINDFLNSTAKIEDVMIDITESLER